MSFNTDDSVFVYGEAQCNVGCNLMPNLCPSARETTGESPVLWYVCHRDGAMETSATTAARPNADDSSTDHDQHSSDDGGSVSKEQSEALVARGRSKTELETLFAGLYPPAAEEDGMRTSRNERLSKGYESISLTYGEVSATGVSFFDDNRSRFWLCDESWMMEPTPALRGH